MIALKSQPDPYGDIKISFEPKELLGRDELILNHLPFRDAIKGRRILITGAAGSIGSELTKQICRFSPEEVTLIDKWEYGLVRLQQQLNGNSRCNIRLADINDLETIAKLFVTAKPQVVFHTAALKHVPFVETQPLAAVNVNIFGTKLLADVAAQNKVEKFIFISSDKAVNPTSLMGATKRFGELIMGCIQGINNTEYITARFGNVMGSSGSVVQIFQEQINQGGPVMITHEAMTRYFMTPYEASQLLLTAATTGRHGNIFIAEMGSAVRILDLAYKMIKLNGLVPYTDIDIQFTGVRQGEKLYEDLLSVSDVKLKHRQNKLTIARLASTSRIDVDKSIAALAGAYKKGESEKIISLLKSVITEYDVPAKDQQLRDHF
jgi:FlaA1/EpsC-like NDP-sugar epimerase